MKRKFQTTRLKPHQCAHCRTMLDAASNPFDTGMPEPGDATLCIYCGEWNIFERHDRLRRPTNHEMVDILTNTNCLRMHDAWLQAVKNQGGTTHDTKRPQDD